MSKRLTQDAMIKATAPDCARFMGYGGGNALVFNWHQIEIRFPARQNQVEVYKRDHGGCLIMANWDLDDLRETAAMIGFRCSDIGD